MKQHFWFIEAPIHYNLCVYGPARMNYVLIDKMWTIKMRYHQPADNHQLYVRPEWYPDMHI